MPPSRAARPDRKPAGRYHHGDLRRALLQEAVRTIHTRGITAVTLREVGQALGVSRTALYRHFADKQALLAAVAGEGFRTLRTALLAAWAEGGQGADGLDRMGLAYVRFAITHPSHYRVMFSGVVRDRVHETLTDPDTHAFQALVDAILEEQRAGRVRADDPQQLALYVWSVVHGVAMLALDGLLPGAPEVDAFTRFANERLRLGIQA
jgi:AcrR family transcriptional regulator